MLTIANLPRETELEIQRLIDSGEFDDSTSVVVRAVHSLTRSREQVEREQQLECLSKPGDGVVEQGHAQAPCLRRSVGDRRPLAPARTTQAQRWSTACAGPGLSDRHSLRAQNRHPLGIPAPGNGLRVRRDLLAPFARLAGGRGLGPSPPHAPRPARGSRSDRLGPGQSGQRQHPG